jgi:hypothetical protein
MQENTSSNVNEYNSDGSCEDIKITLNTVDRSKMTPEELEENLRKSNECDFCISIHRKPEQYTGHTLENCRALKKIRCNFCGNCGHTGGRCETRKPDDKPILFKCSFCFRGNKPERFYMSHTINECRFRDKYNEGKKNFTVISK